MLLAHHFGIRRGKLRGRRIGYSHTFLLYAPLLFTQQPFSFFAAIAIVLVFFGNLQSQTLRALQLHPDAFALELQRQRLSGRVFPAQPQLGGPPEHRLWLPVQSNDLLCR